MTDLREQTDLRDHTELLGAPAIRGAADARTADAPNADAAGGAPGAAGPGEVVDAAPAVGSTQVDPQYSRQVGALLRSIRNQQGMSLLGVERRSQGRFKAVVIGSYERGDRVVSVSRLAELARFYDVPITELLPTGSQPRAHRRQASGGGVVINLRRLRELPPEQSAPADRYVRAIQRERHDYGSDMFPIRSEDLRPLAVMYSTTTDSLLERWRALGILAG
jgi:transcriptional regulator with XRE-family HTH domain